MLLMETMIDIERERERNMGNAVFLWESVSILCGHILYTFFERVADNLRTKTLHFVIIKMNISQFRIVVCYRSYSEYFIDIAADGTLKCSPLLRSTQILFINHIFHRNTPNNTVFIVIKYITRLNRMEKCSGLRM